MQFRFIVNGEVIVHRDVTPSKRKANIYEYYEYIIAQAFFALRRHLFVVHKIDTDEHPEANPFGEAINVYVNEARKLKVPQPFSKVFDINGKRYTFKMIDERLKLTY